MTTTTHPTLKWASGWGTLTSRACSSRREADAGCAAEDCRGTTAPWHSCTQTTARSAGELDAEAAGATAADASVAWDPGVETSADPRPSCVTRGGVADGGGLSEHRRPSSASPASSSSPFELGPSRGVAAEGGVRLPATEAGAALRGPSWRASAAAAAAADGGGGGGDEEEDKVEVAASVSPV